MSRNNLRRPTASLGNDLHEQTEPGIMLMGAAHNGSNNVVAQNCVARLDGVLHFFEHPGRPEVCIGDARITLGGERQCSTQRISDAVDARGRDPGGHHSFAPADQVGDAKQPNRLACQRGVHMQPQMFGVVRRGPAHFEIALIGVDRIADVQRPGILAGIVTGPPARELAGRIDGLPVIENFATVLRLKIVSPCDALGPLRRAQRRARDPCASTFVAPVAERNAGRYPQPIRPLRHGQLAACGGAFGARTCAAWAWLVSQECQKGRRTVTHSATAHY